MEKQQIIRVNKLEKILSMIEKTTKAFEPDKAKGAKLVIDMIREEMVKEPEEKKPSRSRRKKAGADQQEVGQENVS